MKRARRSCSSRTSPSAAFERTLPWSWESYPEYVGVMERLGLGVNVVGLVGHSMLRLESSALGRGSARSDDDEREALARN